MENQPIPQDGGRIIEPDEILSPGSMSRIPPKKENSYERVYTFNTGGHPGSSFAGFVAGMMGLLSGAAVGALIGILAGPAGIVIGAAAGAFIGFLAGMIFGTLAWMMIPKLVRVLISFAVLYAVMNFILTRFFGYPLWGKTLNFLGHYF